MWIGNNTRYIIGYNTRYMIGNNTRYMIGYNTRYMIGYNTVDVGLLSVDSFTSLNILPLPCRPKIMKLQFINK